jgi:hypothetical protein
MRRKRRAKPTRSDFKGVPNIIGYISNSQNFLNSCGGNQKPPSSFLPMEEIGSDQKIGPVSIRKRSELAKTTNN